MLETKKKLESRLFLLCSRVQWLVRIIANTLNNAQTLGLSLSEKYSITRCQELRSLDETESHQSTISCPEQGTVNVNH